MSNWPTTDSEWRRQTKCNVCAELRAELVNARAIAREMFERWKALQDAKK